VTTIAALYVDPRGCYANLPGVDAWPESRDARLYAGPHPVVAHPPCQRWGRYWSGRPGHGDGFTLGDDGGCFAAALASARQWGGVIEHPAESYAWSAHGLTTPWPGGWYVADDCGGWTCHVEQGHYGHRARKATWLYAVGCDLPSLKWGRSLATVRGAVDEDETRQRGTRTRHDAIELMCKRERLATPIAFRDLLLSIARTASRERMSA
jgi:hypothetical protein